MQSAAAVPLVFSDRALRQSLIVGMIFVGAPHCSESVMIELDRDGRWLAAGLRPEFCLLLRQKFAPKQKCRSAHGRPRTVAPNRRANSGYMFNITARTCIRVKTNAGCFLRLESRSCLTRAHEVSACRRTKLPLIATSQLFNSFTNISIMD